MRITSWLLAAALGVFCLQVSRQAAAQDQSVSFRAHRAAVKLPAHVRAYAAEPIGEGRLCVVGVSTDEDGMYQKPIVYVEEAKTKRVLWVNRLKFPARWHESRATHCNKRGRWLFVLQQTDSNSFQSLSQTFLHVVKLSAATGTVQLQQPVHVPDAYSSWVDKGVDRFRWNGDDQLVIVGGLRPDADRESLADFTVHLNSNLKP